MGTSPKIGDKERKLRTRAVRYSFATVRMEGLEPGPEAEAIANRFVDGELTYEEYQTEMSRLALSIAGNGH